MCTVYNVFSCAQQSVSTRVSKLDQTHCTTHLVTHTLCVETYDTVHMPNVYIFFKRKLNLYVFASKINKLKT